MTQRECIQYLKGHKRRWYTIKELSRRLKKNPTSISRNIRCLLNHTEYIEMKTECRKDMYGRDTRPILHVRVK